jgi:hypothetical protein
MKTLSPEYEYVLVCMKVPRNSKRSSAPAPFIYSRTILPSVANLGLVSHRMGVKTDLAMADRIGLVAKHRTGLSRGRLLLPRMLCRNSLPALSLSGTSSSKSLISASLHCALCLGNDRSARAPAGSHIIVMHNECMYTGQLSTYQQQP